MSSKLIIFLEILGLVGAVAFFSGQHREHLNQVQETLATIQKSVKASEKALEDLKVKKEAVANARIETDRKMQEADCLDGNERYEYYDRLLREDAERRCNPASRRAAVPLH